MGALPEDDRHPCLVDAVKFEPRLDVELTLLQQIRSPFHEVGPTLASEHFRGINILHTSWRMVYVCKGLALHEPTFPHRGPDVTALAINVRVSDVRLLRDDATDQSALEVCDLNVAAICDQLAVH
jgi:hypothetical protein